MYEANTGSDEHFWLNPGTYHTVEIQYLTGGFNISWWQATNS
jgi:hypothetical protein